MYIQNATFIAELVDPNAQGYVFTHPSKENEDFAHPKLRPKLYKYVHPTKTAKKPFYDAK